jgi:hypothetical protein
MLRRRRPKFQLRSGVPAGDAMAALPRKSVSGGAPTLPFDARAHGVGSLIDEVAARVSFTVETTVLPSFALREVLERSGVWAWFGVFLDGNLGHAGRWPGEDSPSLFRRENCRGAESRQAWVRIGYSSEWKHCDCAGVA